MIDLKINLSLQFSRYTRRGEWKKNETLSAGGEREREREKGSRAHRVMDDYEHEYVDGI